jgi:hypothetical protein
MPLASTVVKTLGVRSTGTIRKSLAYSFSLLSAGSTRCPAWVDGYLAQDILGALPVAFEGNEDGNLVPDEVVQSPAIDCHGFDEHFAVGDMHDSPSDLVRMDPVADLREGKPGSRQVHNVSRVNANLDAVPHGEGPPPENEHPSHQVHQWVFQGDS